MITSLHQNIQAHFKDSPHSTNLLAEPESQNYIFLMANNAQVMNLMRYQYIQHEIYENATD